MTTEQKVIKGKVGLLELAKQLGSVSQACKVMGYSGDCFYRFKELCEKGGDTLYAIARRNNVAVYDLMTVNGLTSSRVDVGRDRGIETPPARVEIGYRTMTRREKSLRLKRFHESSTAPKVSSLETMIYDLEISATNLSEQIEAEEHRTRNAEPAHFAYSTLAKAARVRRANLRGHYR